MICITSFERMDDPNERIARLFDQLGEKHNELAELLESSTDPKHAESDKKAPRSRTNFSSPELWAKRRFDSDSTE